MKLEAVMENLQRQQAARLALEEKLRKAEKEKDLRALVESQIHQQALAFRHYQAAMRGSLAAAVTGVSPAATFPHMEVHRRDEDARSCRPDSDKERTDEEQEIVDDEEEDEDDDDDDAGLNHHQHRQSARPGARLSPRSSPMHLAARAPAAFGPTRRAESPSAQPQPQHHEWTYEEQFKQQGNTFPEKVTVPLDESGESSADRTDQHARHNDVMWTAVIVTELICHHFNEEISRLNYFNKEKFPNQIVRSTLTFLWFPAHDRAPDSQIITIISVVSVDCLRQFHNHNHMFAVVTVSKISDNFVTGTSCFCAPLCRGLDVIGPSEYHTLCTCCLDVDAAGRLQLRRTGPEHRAGRRSIVTAWELMFEWM
ncbi:hypothetical protein F2P81_013381 [Scophthalmus maximus]|uniref:Uncharacterized protein n=1 Tax=Scophthalmus maximus TaxID=52904 RepID=A0A6A4SL89_SCOMX|nr:hypothetical protein F2P81_013381 [Scophthalmus maximus]